MLPIDFWYHPNSPTTVVINCSALQKRKLRCRQVRHLLEASPLVGMQLGCGELLGKVDRQVVGRWVPTSMVAAAGRLPLLVTSFP